MTQTGKNLPAMQETQVWFLGRENPLEEEMAAQSSILVWRILWTEEPGRRRWERRLIQRFHLISESTFFLTFSGTLFHQLSLLLFISGYSWFPESLLFMNIHIFLVLKASKKLNSYSKISYSLSLSHYFLLCLSPFLQSHTFH